MSALLCDCAFDMMDLFKDFRYNILRTGESQRKDLIYQYRYTDRRGVRQTIYDADVQELRRKASRFTARRMTALTLWFMKLHMDGRGYSTITTVRGVVKPAFQMACDEDAVRKNPFIFKLTDVVPNDSEKRLAMTEEELDTWMTFIRTDKTYSKYYDEFVVLLETGMRVSEFCGLIRDDLDFQNRRIRVDHQLVRERGGKYYGGDNEDRQRSPLHPHDGRRV